MKKTKPTKKLPQKVEKSILLSAMREINENLVRFYLTMDEDMGDVLSRIDEICNTALREVDHE